MSGDTEGRFRAGDSVRVRTGNPRDHIRTPAYIRGKSGRVVSVHGEFRNPESLAYGGTGFPKQPLYQVGFAQREVWPDYGGSSCDMLYVDIYEHWLEPA